MSLSVIVLMFMRTRLAKEKLQPEMLEAFVVGIGVLALTVAVGSSPTRTAKLFGYTLQEAFGRPEEPAYDSDSTILLTIDLVVTATYLGIPVRWSSLSPLGISAVLLYIGILCIVGSEENRTGVSLNVVLLTTLVATAMIGKRWSEREERAAFLQMIEEKSKRCEAEYELAQVRETAVKSQTSASAKSHKIFEALFDKTTDSDRTAQLESVAKMGDSEHWRIPEVEVQLIPNGDLGRGGFGVVEKAIFCGLVVAVKRPRLDHGPLKIPDLCNELRVLRHLRHPNIVTAHGAVIRPEEQEIMLVLELINGCSLTAFLLPGEQEAEPSPFARYQVMLGVCRALLYMHTRLPAIVHGDLKGGNVMVERTFGEMCPKVLDFGLSRVLSGPSRALGGTLAWLAPEVLEQAPVHTSADVYSFGRMLAFTATGIVPMRDMQRAAVMRALLKKKPPLPVWPDDCIFRNASSALVKACLAGDPQQRPTIAYVHRFLLDLPGRIKLASEEKDHPLLKEVQLLAGQLDQTGEVAPEPSAWAGANSLPSLPEETELDPSGGAGHSASLPVQPTSGRPFPFQDLRETSQEALECLLLRVFQRCNVIPTDKDCCRRHALFQAGLDACQRAAKGGCAGGSLLSSDEPPRQCWSCGVLFADNVCDICGMEQAGSTSLESTKEAL